jgi:hypothetical protein
LEAYSCEFSPGDRAPAHAAEAQLAEIASLGRRRDPRPKGLGTPRTRWAGRMGCVKRGSRSETSGFAGGIGFTHPTRA